MLQHDFKNIDLEFIYLWSRFKLENNQGAIVDDLKDLALRGQINAIQKWYLLHSVTACPELDKRMEEMQCTNYEELWAKGLYEQRKDEKIGKLESLVKEHRSLYKKIEYIAKSGDAEEKEELPDYMAKIESLENDMKQKTYLSYYRQAYRLAREEAKALGSVFSGLRACEMMKMYARELPTIELFQRQAASLLMQASQKNQLYVKEFIAKHKKFSAGNITPHHQPQFYYNMAKSLVLFKSENLFNKNKYYKKLSDSIYEDLTVDGLKLKSSKENENS